MSANIFRRRRVWLLVAWLIVFGFVVAGLVTRQWFAGVGPALIVVTVIAVNRWKHSI